MSPPSSARAKSNTPDMDSMGSMPRIKLSRQRINHTKPKIKIGELGSLDDGQKKYMEK